MYMYMYICMYVCTCMYVMSVCNGFTIEMYEFMQVYVHVPLSWRNMYAATYLYIASPTLSEENRKLHVNPIPTQHYTIPFVSEIYFNSVESVILPHFIVQPNLVVA